MTGSVHYRRIRLALVLLALVLTVLLALPASPAHATQLFVSTLGSDTAGNGSVGSPYATVQHAIGVAVGGDEVHVGGGTFNGDVTMKNRVSLFGAGSAGTTLVGTGTWPVITATGIDSGTTIAGFALTGGGGAYGSGIFCSSSSPSIINNTIRGNSADSGGGIFCSSSSPSIINNTIVGNTATLGGGIACSDPVSLPRIVNCIIWDNGDDLFHCSATYSCVENASAASGLGNTSTPPSFVDTATGDFHLSDGSPCIDAATSTVAPSTDKDGARRPRGGGFDIGAYEYVPPTYTIKPTAGAHGSIAPSTTQTVDEGADCTFSIAGDPGYRVGAVLVDGVSVGAVRNYTFTNVTGNRTISATFAPNIAGTIMGKVTLQEDIPVYRLYRPSNGSYFWTITDAERDQLMMSSDYVYDGVAFCLPKGGTIPVWRFRNKLDGTYLWTADPAERASINATMSGAWIEEGTAYQLTPGTQLMWRFSKKTYWAYLYTPDFQEMSDVSSDPNSSWSLLGPAWSYAPGTTVGAAVEGIQVVAYRNVGGSWQVEGTTNSDASGNYEITGLPDGAYRIGFFDSAGKRYLDQYSGGGWANYAAAPTLQTASEVTVTPSAVNDNLNVALSEATSTHVWASAGVGGSIKPSGVLDVDRGGDRSFQLVPDSGFHINTLAIDGGSAEPTTATSYAFSGVTTPHAIVVTFARDSFTITPSVGAHGSISPSTVQTVSPGGSKQFTIAADTGYHIKDVLKDNVSIGASSSVTFSDVSADHTIRATFAMDPVIATVWRFRNLNNDYYLWTASPEEKANIEETLSATWVLEGEAYQIETSSPQNDSPLWRFVNIKGGYYLYTASSAERAEINTKYSDIWFEEGEAYKVASVPGGTEVWRFRNKQDGTYLFSASACERADINNRLSATWLEEGTAFYVVGP